MSIGNILSFRFRDKEIEYIQKIMEEESMQWILFILFKVSLRKDKNLLCFNQISLSRVPFRVTASPFVENYVSARRDHENWQNQVHFYRGDAEMLAV